MLGKFPTSVAFCCDDDLKSTDAKSVAQLTEGLTRSLLGGGVSVTGSTSRRSSSTPHHEKTMLTIARHELRITCPGYDLWAGTMMTKADLNLLPERGRSEDRRYVYRVFTLGRLFLCITRHEPHPECVVAETA